MKKTKPLQSFGVAVPLFVRLHTEDDSPLVPSGIDKFQPNGIASFLLDGIAEFTYYCSICEMVGRQTWHLLSSCSMALLNLPITVP